MKIRFQNILNEDRNIDLYELDEANDIAKLIIKKVIAHGFKDGKLFLTLQEVRPFMHNLKGLSKTPFVISLNIENQEGYATEANFEKNINGNPEGVINVSLFLGRGNYMAALMNQLTSVLAHELNHYYDFASNRLENDTLGGLLEKSKHKDSIMKYLKNISSSTNTKLKETMIYMLKINEIRSMTKEIINLMNYNSVDFDTAAMAYYDSFSNNQSNQGLEKVFKTIMVYLWTLYYQLNYKK